MTATRRRAARGVVIQPVLVVAAAAFVAFGLRGPGARADATVFSSNSVQMTLAAGGIGLSPGSTATGVWSGEPEPYGTPQRVSYTNGDTVYYWYFRGLGGTEPANEMTEIVATDTWRTTNSSYSSATDTIELTAANGTRFRRPGTPVYGVVVIHAPSVSEQAEAGTLLVDDYAKVRLKLPDGSFREWTVLDVSWRANITNASYAASGASHEVTGQPNILPAQSEGRFWGSGAPLGASPPSIISESVVDATTWSIVVPGFSEDVSGASIFAVSGAAANPNIDITVMQGLTERRAMAVGWVAPGSEVTNSITTRQMVISVGNGMMPVPPPPPPDQRVMRFAVLYVPGDTRALPAINRTSGGDLFR